MVKKTEKPIEKFPEKTEDYDSSKIKFNDIQPTESVKGMEDNDRVSEKKKRGRPSKAEKQAESQEQVLKITEDIFTPVFNLINRILINRYSPVVKLNEDEITSLKFYLALVANKYLPSAIQKFGAEVTLGILTFTIAADKTIKYQEWKQTSLKQTNLEQSDAKQTSLKQEKQDNQTER